MKKLILLMAVFFCCVSCGIKKTVSVKTYYPPVREVKVINQGQTLPSNIERIGSVSVGGGVFTKTGNCTYESCLEELTTEAKKAGADIVYIVQIRQPEPGKDTCYSMTAELYVYKQ